jgi:hypothetical protein
MGKIGTDFAIEEAKRLIREANQRGLTLRLMGGVAVLLHSHSSEVPKELERVYGDLDFAGLSRETPKITRFFSEMGYEPNRRFNAVLGSVRLLFNSDGEVDHVDVIMDRFRMCHTWDLRSRLPIDRDTLPVADLLLSKLQVVMLSEKDLKDIYLLLLNHAFGSNDQDQINTTYLARLLGSDWGLWRTVTINLKEGLEHLEELQFKEKVAIMEKMRTLMRLADTIPKSAGWKIRAVVGDRIKWYELPEDVKH